MPKWAKLSIEFTLDFHIDKSTILFHLTEIKNISLQFMGAYNYEQN